MAQNIFTSKANDCKNSRYFESKMHFGEECLQPSERDVSISSLISVPFPRMIVADQNIWLTNVYQR